MDWYSLIDATALFTSLPRTGYNSAAVRTRSVILTKTTHEDFRNPRVVRNALEECIG